MNELLGRMEGVDDTKTGEDDDDNDNGAPRLGGGGGGAFLQMARFLRSEEWLIAGFCRIWMVGFDRCCVCLALSSLQVSTPTVHRTGMRAVLSRLHQEHPVCPKR